MWAAVAARMDEPTSIITDIRRDHHVNNYVFVSSTSDAPTTDSLFSATQPPDIPPGLPSEMPAAGMQFLKTVFCSAGAAGSAGFFLFPRVEPVAGG